MWVDAKDQMTIEHTAGVRVGDTTLVSSILGFYCSACDEVRDRGQEGIQETRNHRESLSSCAVLANWPICNQL